MKNKRLIIVIFILAFVFIGIGIFLNTYSNTIEVDNLSDNKDSNKENGEYIIVNEGVEVNDNKNVSDKHCLDKICINDLILSSHNNDYFITGNFKNESGKNIKEKYLNIIFVLEDGKELKQWYYISSLDVGGTYYIQMSTDTNILNVVDYRMENPTEDELIDYKKEIASIEY